MQIVRDVEFVKRGEGRTDCESELCLILGLSFIDPLDAETDILSRVDAV